MPQNKFFIIDFDSTLTQVEALEELASISMKNNPKRADIYSKIKDITNLGMEGKLPISESLSQRIKMLHANKKHIEMLVNVLKKKITPSFLRNKDFFKLNSENVFIISNGFREFIVPIARQFSIPEKNVYANTFTFDKKGSIRGFDTKNILSGENGKAEQLKALNLKGDIYVIGDGYTDYQLKETGLVTKFFAFTENVARETVVKNADYVAPTFDEFLYVNKLPMSISYPKNRIKALLLENIHADAVSIFRKEGYNVEAMPKSMHEDELCEKIKDISILCIRSKTQVTAKVIENASRLMIIGVFGIGTNQVDMNACLKKGICIFNAPYSSTRSVVELAIGSIIMLMRKAFDRSTELHQGIWNKSAADCFEIREKKLGIIGYGNIGSQLSVLAESLGMEVYYYDIIDKMPLGNAKKCSSMEELLKKADVISLHVEGGPKNKKLIAEEQFKLMKNGVIFMNLSRGSLVDMDALAKHIKNGKVRGAAIDVYAAEPKSNAEKFECELKGLPNVILTPHIGGSTEEAQQNIAEFVPRKIMEFVNNGSTSLSVNFPNLQLPKLQNAHRLIHIHHNVPGVLSQINGVLAKNNINIIGQYLKTNEQIGYAITDVSKEYNKQVTEDLKMVSNTIKFRVLY